MLRVNRLENPSFKRIDKKKKSLMDGLIKHNILNRIGKETNRSWVN
jgi:hypothetical protein